MEPPMALRSDNVRVLLVLGFFHLAVIVTTSDKLYFTLFSLFALAYASYYVTFVVHQPDIHCSRSPIERFLRAHCPAMFATFYPTIWTAGGHARTIVRCIFQRTPPSIEFSRETLSGADGGLFCIDWITEKGTRSLRGRDRIVVVIPGVTGGSEEPYAQHIAAAVIEKGYGCVILTQRGNQDTPLTTPRTYCATSFEDVRTIHNHIAKKFPTSEIFLVGISLGALQVTHYLGHLGSEAKEKSIAGAMVISMPYELFRSKETIEAPLTHMTAGTYLILKTRGLYRRHRKIFDANKDRLPFDLDYGLQARTMTEIDSRIICPMYGYASWQEYYREATPLASMAKIKVPYLALNAEDDPFSPGYAIPTDVFQTNPYLILMKTKVGGHIGFTEDFFPTGITLTEKVLAQFAHTCFTENTPKTFNS
ncbi:phospholipase ABHD3-like [Oscarella lobularis]|uniref:phospholipase ABHD3-like n=1 Tax=Oscarella lobularis TaxID=121494 RepID=UPI00331430FF